MTFGQSWIDILPILRVQWVGFSHLPYKIYGYNAMFFLHFYKGKQVLLHPVCFFQGRNLSKRDLLKKERICS